MAQLLVVMLICPKCYVKDVVILCIVQIHKLLLLIVNCHKRTSKSLVPFFNLKCFFKNKYKY